MPLPAHLALEQQGVVYVSAKQPPTLLIKAPEICFKNWRHQKPVSLFYRHIAFIMKTELDSQSNRHLQLQKERLKDNDTVLKNIVGLCGSEHPAPFSGVRLHWVLLNSTKLTVTAERASLHHPGWPVTHSVDQISFKLRELVASVPATERF